MSKHLQLLKAQPNETWAVQQAMAEPEMLSIYQCSAEIELLFWSLKQMTKNTFTTNCIKAQSDWYEQSKFFKNLRKITGKLCCHSKSKLHQLVFWIMKEIQLWLGDQHLNKCQGEGRVGLKSKKVWTVSHLTWSLSIAESMCKIL